MARGGGRRRRRFLLHTVVIALAGLPFLPVGLDLLAPLAGLPLTLLAIAALQLPALVELTGLGRERRGDPVTLAGWHLFYGLWVGAIVYSIVAGLTRLTFLCAGETLLAAATPAPWLAAVPFALSGWGVVVGQRRYPREERRLEVDGLPAELAGLTIVQLSDLHMGRFFGERRLSLLVARAREAKPDLVVVTGDIVDDSARFAPAAARLLASIEAPLGVFACLGNHDHHAGANEVGRALTAAGIRVLRNEGLSLSRGGASLWLCGVDDLWFGGDLTGALAGKPEGTPALLLSHQPALFPEAARRGVALTLSGHTHGGQLAVPFFPQASLARLITRFVAGPYATGRSLLYVNRGAGAIRPLVRLGAPPEVAVLRLDPLP